MKISRKILGTVCLGLAASLVAAGPPRLVAAEDAAAAPAANPAAATSPGGFQFFVGVVGNPSVPDISWSDQQLEQIKGLGVNVVQLSIAWGHKPANEEHSGGRRSPMRWVSSEAAVT